MSQLVGTIVLLTLMVWLIETMIPTMFGNNKTNPPKRYERPPTHWWKALVWVPIGYSLVKLIGQGTPTPLLFVTAALLAVVQRFFPRSFELIIGTTGTLVALGGAIEGTNCKPTLGPVGFLALTAFAGLAILAIVLSGKLITKTAQFVSVGAAVIELVLFTVSPVGGTLLPDYGLAALTLPAVAVGIAFLVGTKPTLGMTAIGVSLIAAEVAVALTPNSCDTGALTAVAASAIFAGTRLLLSKRSTRQLVGVR